MAVIKTQGTNVYAVLDGEVTQLVCLTSIDLGSDSTNRIENTCLEATDTKSYVPGLSDPAEASLGFNIDTENASHLQLVEWANDKQEGVMFYVGASDGTGAITATPTETTVPTTRSWWVFEAGLTTPVPSFEADSLVGYTVTLQRSSAVGFTPAV